MTLTRNNMDENYYVDGGSEDRELKQMMDKHYSESVTLNQSFWSQADIDTRFKAGDQTLWNDLYGNVPAFRKKQFSFNKIQRIINMISGYQRLHRKNAISIPVENNDQEASDDVTALLSWDYRITKAHDIYSDAFEKGSLTSGMGLIEHGLDYSRDPLSGNPFMDYVPYSSFIIDPYFAKRDLSDCNFIWRRKWRTKEMLKKLLPGREKEIDSLPKTRNQDGKFQFMAEAYNYAQYELHAVDEYYHVSERKQKLLVDVQTGEVIEWRGEEPELRAFLAQFPQIQVKNTQVPTVKLGIVVDGRVFYHGGHPDGLDQYPFAAALGYHEPEIPYMEWRTRGVVRDLRDAQYLYNRRKVIELDILESQVNSGYKYKVDSLVNPKDIFLEGQGKGIALKKGAEMTDVEKIQPGQIPPSMFQLSEILSKEIMEISGANEELLGMAEDDKAAILAMARQGAGLVTLQKLFDGFDFTLKKSAEIKTELMVKNFTEGKMRRILGREPSQALKQATLMFYDIEIVEGLNTPTQKQLRMAQLLQFREAGIPVPSKTILEASDIQNKNELIKDIQEQEQQQAQMQQMQAQMEMAVRQKEMQLLDSRSVAEEGLGIERLARVAENKELAVERKAKAIEDLSDAKLNKIKMLKELDSMEIDRIARLVEIVKALEEPEESIAQAESAASDQFLAGV